MTTWKIDTTHTDVTFAAKHMMVTTVRGKFGDVSGEIEVDPNDPSTARGEIRIAVASLNTGTQFRDDHLRSADFFDVGNHPYATFAITDVKARGDEYEVTGDLTIRGVTRPFTFKAELLGYYRSMEGAKRVGFSAAAKLNRKDWGLNWNVALESGGWLVGDEVKLTIDAAFEEVREARGRESVAA
jgi:polyisoprenoid-binding protein YceI